MAVSLFLHYTGEAADPAAFLEAYKAGSGGSLTAIDGATSVELYTPLPIDDPRIDDGMGPLLVVQVRFATLAAAEAALRAPALSAALADFQGLAVRDWQICYEIVGGEPVEAAGETDPATTALPVCYLVRYERPADDEAHFIEYYCEHHPPLMAEMPAIRRCEIYTQLGWIDALPVARADHMLICDTSFDSAEALNAALRSDVRDRLREDFHSLPRFEGRCTHFGMQRTRLLP